jgi:tetratricopeptide (TPR) repeat protein
MGYLGCLFAWMHPIRHTGRRIRRAVTPRPIRRMLRAKNQVLHPISSAERSVFRAVDRAVTPKRTRKRRQRAAPTQESALQQLIPGQPHVTREPAQLLKEFAALDANDLEDAERTARAVIGQMPTYGMAYNTLGFLLLGRGLVRDALDAFHRAEELSPDRLELIEANIASCQYVLGNAAASSALFDNCLNVRSFAQGGILHGISGANLFLVSVQSQEGYSQLMALNAGWSALRAGRAEIAESRAAIASGLMRIGTDVDVAASLEELKAELGARRA